MGEEALAKNILLQNKLHLSQSCDNNQLTNQNNSLNFYIQLKKKKAGGGEEREGERRERIVKSHFSL